MTDTTYTIFDIETDQIIAGGTVDKLLQDGRALDFGEGDANGLTYIAVPESDKDACDMIKQAHPDAPIFDITAPTVDEARDTYQDIMGVFEQEEEEEDEDDWCDDEDDLPASTPPSSNPAPQSQPTGNPAAQPTAKPTRPKQDNMRSTRARHDFVKGMKARRTAAAKRAAKPQP